MEGEGAGPSKNKGSQKAVFHGSLQFPWSQLDILAKVCGSLFCQSVTVGESSCCSRTLSEFFLKKVKLPNALNLRLFGRDGESGYK